MPATDLRLVDLAPAQRGVITAIQLPPDHKARLLEMGVLVGTTIELVRFAPLGDPVELKVRGYRLSLRKHEAEQILIRPA